MATKTKIEWTDVTWNPIRGCKEVSPGCENCYAAAMAARFAGPGKPYEGLATFGANGKPRWTGDILVVEKALTEPLRWKRPWRVFVNSMSDLFHERLPWTVIDAVFAVMYEAHQHAFQVLTKRPERMREYVQSRPIGRIAHKVWWHLHQRDLDKAKLLSPEDIARDIAAMWPLPNVWLGVSVEDQERASRIDHLVQTPAAVRFISAEPLLGPLEFCDCDSHLTPVGRHFPRCRLKKINQVIVGGESGPNARPCNPDWVRLIRDQCETSGVAFFFKQWGSWAPWTPDDRHGVFGTPDTAISHFWEDENDRAISLRIGKKGAGRMLDWREWNEFPEGVKSC